MFNIFILAVNIGGCLVFAPFLPKSKDECKKWQMQGQTMGSSRVRGYLTCAIAVVVICYGIMVAILLLDSDTSCLTIVGGEGC